VVRESPVRAGGHFDLPGTLGFAAALVCLLLAVSKGTEWGWGSASVLGMFGAAVVLFLLWGLWELRARSPLVDLRVSARPTVLWTNAASIMIGFGMFAGFLVTTQILQAPRATGYGFGLSLVAAGLVLLPIGGAMTIFSPVSARVSRWRGPRTTLVLGAVVLAVGNVLMAVLPDSVPLIIAASTTMAIGAALAYSALPLLIMGSVPPTETAAANSLNTVMRMLGTSSCSAFVAAIATASTSVIDGQALPSATAYTVIYLAAGGAAVIGAVIAAFIPRTARRVQDEAAVPLPAPAA
jgi:predicted MFS family arabinose efflux permease